MTNLDQDQVLFIPLCSRCSGAIESLGRPIEAANAGCGDCEVTERCNHGLLKYQTLLTPTPFPPFPPCEGGARGGGPVAPASRGCPGRAVASFPDRAVVRCPDRAVVRCPGRAIGQLPRPSGCRLPRPAERLSVAPAETGYRFASAHSAVNLKS